MAQLEILTLGGKRYKTLAFRRHMMMLKTSYAPPDPPIHPHGFYENFWLRWFCVALSVLVQMTVLGILGISRVRKRFCRKKQVAYASSQHEMQKTAEDTKGETQNSRQATLPRIASRSHAPVLQLTVLDCKRYGAVIDGWGVGYQCRNQS